MTALAEDVPDTTVRAVGVVVPARDEQAAIVACLTSVRRALSRLPDAVDVAVAVVLDRCTDATPERVDALVRDWPEVVTIRVTEPPSARNDPGAESGSDVGALRDLGMRAVLRRLTAHEPAATWLLSTDADTTVPSDWAVAHLRFADAGADAVAGLADLGTVEHLRAETLLRYHAIVRRHLRGDTHRHVYAANLGVRADAYLAVGGFPRNGAGEDHGLWHRLGDAGYTLVQPVSVRVRTSARVRGRAEGGLAGLLRSLDGEPPDGRYDSPDDGRPDSGDPGEPPHPEGSVVAPAG